MFVKDSEKKFLGKWWVWITFLIIVSSIAFGALKYLGIYGTTVAERIIFENSYQKTAADKKAKNIYSAQLAEIEYRLNGELDDNVRSDLNAQAAMLRVQSRALNAQ